jgi:hypothetical protein
MREGVVRDTANVKESRYFGAPALPPEVEPLPVSVPLVPPPAELLDEPACPPLDIAGDALCGLFG